MALEIEYVKPDSLKPYAVIARRIDSQALSALSRLLDEHGFIAPVVARRQDRLLLGGHHRIKANALRDTPAKLIPCIFLDDISDERAKAISVGLNNPAAQGCFDVDALAELLAGLAQEIPEQNDSVSVIMEMPTETYQQVRPSLDRMIANHSLACHVRMGRKDS